MPRHGRRSRKFNLEQRSKEFNLERAMELLLKAHSKGELGEHIETLKNLAAELPNVSQDENRLKKFIVGAKQEVYDISATIIAKLIKEFTTGR